MTDWVTAGLAGSVALFAAAAALESRGRHRRLTDELARQPATPPSLYPRINLEACMCSGACLDACPEHDVIGLLAGRPRLIRASACVGHADCVRSCPAQAIELVLGSPERAVEVPVMSSAFETTVPGLYVAGELTGMGLIHNAVAQGVQAAAAALAGLAGGPAACEHDLAIIGAGPAGLGAALEARRRGARAIVLEKSVLGGAIQSYPRQKVVMSAPFELPTIGKVKLRRTTKEALLALFADVVRRAALPIVERAEVRDLAPIPGGFAITAGAAGTAGARTLTARRVVLAIGRRGTPRRLAAPGAELPHVIYGVTEPAAYAGQPIAVIGGGDSAVELALALAAQPRTPVALVHRGADFGRCKPDNRAALDAAAAAGALRVHTGAVVRAVRADHVELGTPTGPRAIAAAAVVCCLGAELPSQWLRGLGVRLRALRGEPLT